MSGVFVLNVTAVYVYVSIQGPNVFTVLAS